MNKNVNPKPTLDPFSAERLRARITAEAPETNYKYHAVAEEQWGFAQIPIQIGARLHLSLGETEADNSSPLLDPTPRDSDPQGYRAPKDYGLRVRPYARIPIAWLALDCVGLKLMVALSEAAILLACRASWEPGGPLPKDVLRFVCASQSLDGYAVMKALRPRTIREKELGLLPPAALALKRFQEFNFDIESMMGRGTWVDIPMCGLRWWTKSTAVSWSILYSLVSSHANRAGCINALTANTGMTKRNAYWSLDSLCRQGLLEFYWEGGKEKNRLYFHKGVSSAEPLSDDRAS